MRSGSWASGLHVRPPFCVTQSSTVAGPAGPASATSYWRLNRGLGMSCGLSAGLGSGPGRRRRGAGTSNGFVDGAGCVGAGGGSRAGASRPARRSGTGAGPSTSVEANVPTGDGSAGPPGVSSRPSAGFSGVPSGRTIEASWTFCARSATWARTRIGPAVPASHVALPAGSTGAGTGTCRQSLAPTAWNSSTKELRSSSLVVADLPADRRQAPAPAVRGQGDRRRDGVDDHLHLRLDRRGRRRIELALGVERLDREPVFAVLRGAIGQGPLVGGGPADDRLPRLAPVLGDAEQDLLDPRPLLGLDVERDAERPAVVIDQLDRRAPGRPPRRRGPARASDAEDEGPAPPGASQSHPRRAVGLTRSSLIDPSDSKPQPPARLELVESAAVFLPARFPRRPRGRDRRADPETLSRDIDPADPAA